MIHGIPETGFVRLSQVLTVIPIGRSTWWAGVKSGKYPKSIKLSIRCTVWKAEDIHGLIKDLADHPHVKN
jgi:predicted DNA-binding transcriptional regulator AlpA